MANVIIDDTYLSGIANAIRAKTGGSDTYTPAQMATAIGNLPTGGGSSNILPTVYKRITNTESGSGLLEVTFLGSTVNSIDNFAAIIMYQINGPCFFITKSELENFIELTHTRSSKQYYIPINTLGGKTTNSNMDGWNSQSSSTRYPVMMASNLFTWDNSTSTYSFKTWGSNDQYTIALGVYTILPENCSDTSYQSGVTQTLSGTWYACVLYEKFRS